MNGCSPTPTSDKDRILAAYRVTRDQDRVAKKLGLPRNLVRRVISESAPNFRRKLLDEPQPEFIRSEVPPADVPVEELIRRKYDDYALLEANRKASFIHTIKLRTNEPIGLAWFGDPHIDNNGCNLKLLHTHADIVRETPGLFGINLGDNLDLWIGRLMRLYADARTTDHDGRRLLEDFIERVGLKNWLAFVFGNHDIWDGQGHPLHRTLVGPVVEKYNVRLRLVFPNQRQVKIWIRHDFPGNSQWNDVHGLMKAAQMGADFDIFAAGHKHTSSHHEQYNDKNGTYWHAFRSAGYKMVDEYPEELGLPDLNVFQCPVTIIDPEAVNPTQLVKFEPDTADGADRLNWLRKKRAAGLRRQ
jgi:hypothetical protein